MSIKNKIICVVGATASGKTDLALSLAKKYNTVIISADSRQVFKELSIGTAKPSKEQLNEVPHYFINSHHINELFSAGDFEREAMLLLQKLFATHQYVIVCGGTGLYIRALCQGLDKLPKSDLSIRDTFNNLSIQNLQNKLQLIDPDYYKIVDLNNKQRVIRAIEVFETSGKPFSSFLQGNGFKRDFDIEQIAIDIPREQLYQRINLRVDNMMQAGLLKEVQDNVTFRTCNAFKTVGYTELLNYIDGKYSLDFAIDKIKQHTRNYAKRQLTWFKADSKIKWITTEV